MCNVCSTVSPFPTPVVKRAFGAASQAAQNKIDLANEAFFIAAGDTFQILKPETTRPRKAREREWLDELPEDF